MEKLFKSGSKSWRLLLFAGMILLMALIMGACAEAETPAPTDVPPPPPPTPTELPDQSAFIAAVEGNAMNFYSVEHAPNTHCARCHSPQNWDPEAFFGPPPDCFTCKFAHEEEMRVAPGNPLIPEEEWVGVPCETCHTVEANGIVNAGITWFNPVEEEYQEVSNPTELCEKCHVSTAGGSFGMVAGSRGIELGGSAHINYAGFLGTVPPPTYCSDCHDPHSLEPKQCVDCHEDVTTSDTHMLGYNALMLDKVTCMACHDASGLDAGPDPREDMGDLWVTQETTFGRGGPSTDYVLSHSIQYEVSCDRCHSKGNIHGLSTLDSDGEPAEETICVVGETLTVAGETLTVLYDDLGTYGVVDEDYTMGECPTELVICSGGEALTVLYDDLGTYGVVDEDYTVGECPTE